VDVVLHPKRSVIDMEFAALEREVRQVFRSIQSAAEKQQLKQQAGVGDGS
jgi:ribonuclease P protein component